MKAREQTYGECVTFLVDEYQRQCRDNHAAWDVKSGYSLYTFMNYTRKVTQGEG